MSTPQAETGAGAAAAPALPADYLESAKVGKQLVEFCRKGEFFEAINTLYADDCKSVEPCADPSMPAELDGIEVIRNKNKWWSDNHEVHSFEAQGPYPHGNRFAVMMKMEATPKTGPMAGQRVPMEEVCLYTVAHGKIVKEEFMYDMTTG